MPCRSTPVGDKVPPVQRAPWRHYHTLSRRSTIDESLFGRSLPTARRCRRSRDSYNEELRSKKPPRVTVQSSNFVTAARNLDKNPDDDEKSAIIRNSDYERMKKSSVVVTKQERETIAEQRKAEFEKAEEESLKRARKFHIIDFNRNKNDELFDLEDNEQQRNESLRHKAVVMRQENEEEIKKLNELILDAKVHAVRDAQCMEKMKIKKMEHDEETRLIREMEIDRINAVRIQEEIEQKRKDERMIGAMHIMEQIKQNEREKLLELERKDQENKKINAYVKEMCESVLEQRDERSKKKLQLRKELDSCLDDAIRQKQLEREQDRLLTEKVLACRREKDARVEAYEKEQAKIRHEKELQTARMRQKQERDMNFEAERDALRAVRAQQQADREWRKKEQLEAWKRAQTEDLLRRANLEQQELKKHFQSVEVQRNRTEFENVLRAHREDIEKKRRETDKVRENNRKHLTELQQQIRRREKERIQALAAKYEEGIKLHDDAARRRQQLNEIKASKLNELRSLGINEKYCQLIESKLTHLKLQ